jgi:uncharacterized surface protein with fasciclin (FAS1) repeats
MKIRTILATVISAALFTTAPIAVADMHEEGHKENKTIAELAMGNEDLSTLVSLVKAADLVETLKSEGPFTVFAPTNEAFGALTEEQVTYLTSDEGKATLKEILLYHVVPAKVMAADVEPGEVETAYGEDTIEVSMEDGNVMVDNAKVIKTDIKASNGVVHVINAVILPEGVDLEG